jgi:cellulose synthase/poly-beta-1,6-N-acetylglucosamine synthase-like glycosyltransferase
MKSAVSVVIPAYNSEKTIGPCLEALKNQTVRPLEIIVVDGNSSDKTREMAKDMGARVFVEKRRGPAVARNLGASKARGEILLFTDADCIPGRDWIREMLKPFKTPSKGEGIAGVQGSYRTRQESLVARFAQFEIEQRYERLERRRHIDFIGTYSAAYQRALFLKSGGFDEDFPEASGEDPELSFRLSKAGYRMVFNPGARVFHQHPDTLEKYLKQKFSRARWRVLLYRKHPGKAVSESYTPQTLKLQICLFYLFVLSLILSPFHSVSIYVAVSLLILLFLSALPFSVRAAREEGRLGLVSPVILILRSVTFSIGLVYGVFKSI